MNRIFLLISALIFIAPVLSSAEDLTVAVAADFQYAFEELKSVFETQTGITIKDIIGSSGKFVSQIENGAPFDLFLSADVDLPQALYKKGLTCNQPRIYVYGTLVLWTGRDLDLSQGIEVLKNTAIETIAIPNPQTAPYGRQAVNALKYYKLYDRIQKKLIFGESIAQVNWFITTQASDIGFTAKSIVLSPHMKTKGTWMEIDKIAYEPMAQGAVILKYAESSHLSAAQKFFEFLFSKEARDIYEEYGYIVPN